MARRPKAGAAYGASSPARGKGVGCTVHRSSGTRRQRFGLAAGRRPTRSSPALPCAGVVRDGQFGQRRRQVWRGVLSGTPATTGPPLKERARCPSAEGTGAAPSLTALRAVPGSKRGGVVPRAASSPTHHSAGGSLRLDRSSIRSIWLLSSTCKCFESSQRVEQQRDVGVAELSCAGQPHRAGRP